MTNMSIEQTITFEGAGATIEQASRETKHQSFLLKPDNLQEEIGNLPVNKEIKDKLLLYGRGRPTYHMLRLMAADRTLVENNFGLIYLNHYKDISQDLKVQDKNLLERIGGVTGGEGPDTCMWWTFAPYLQAILQERGLDETLALLRVVRWADCGVVFKPENRIGLQGLESMHISHQYVLGKNPIGPSHIFTQYVAKQIVDKILIIQD